MPAIFPRWTNEIPIVFGYVAPFFGAFVVFGVWYWFSPWYTDVGYRPRQPVPYSHKLHAGELGLDCRYCHNTVEVAAHAAIPPTATCMNCHQLVNSTLPGNLRGKPLDPVRHSLETGEPVEWVRVHQLPDYAYFTHASHVAAGVPCVRCHGRIDEMEIVEMDQPLSMGWCLECHRDPEPNLGPLDEVTRMTPREEPYDPSDDPKRKREVDPPVHCSGCHR